ncbi:MAG: sugar porter family MFS transporter [Candidatus Nanopelagicales bacterium]|nr:sugar porter family MFS transporter [Candidatus Nanopelagicales bacterium]
MMAKTESGTGDKSQSHVQLVVLTAVALGIIFGYDNGNIGGAQLFFEVDLDLDRSQIELVTAVLVSGELLGCLAGGFLANLLGRKKVVILATAGYVLFCLTSAFSANLAQLQVSRALLGISIGVSLVAAPVFIAESVPIRTRGSTLVMFQVTCVAGTILGLVGSILLAGLDQGVNWRVMLGLAAIPAALLLPILLRLPETANWLLLKGREEDARATLTRLEPDEDPEPLIAEIEAAIAEETGGAFREMLTRPYLRATVFVVILGLFVQLTGINATVTYGPRIFKALGIDSAERSLLLEALVQVIALIAVLASMSVIDSLGRRPTLLTGIGIMVFAQIMLVVAFGTEVGNTLDGAQVVLGFAGLALINVGFVFGFGALVWVYSVESFPARLRAYGSSIMLSAVLFGNLLIARYFLFVLETIGGAWSFGMFAALAVVAWFFVYKFAPETKGRPLDDIRYFWENGGKWPEEAGASSGRA